MPTRLKLLLFFFAITVNASHASAAGNCAADQIVTCPKPTGSIEACQSTNQDVAAHLTFNFETKFSCDRIQNNPLEPKKHELCVAEKQKDWTPSEKDLVQRTINRMIKNPKLRSVFLELAANGPIELHRSNSATTLDEKNKPTDIDGAYAFFSKDKNGVTLTDFFFSEAKRMNNSCAGFLFPTADKELEHVLVHELAHEYAFYKSKLDEDCSFLKAAGWSAFGESLNVIDAKKLESLRQAGRDLIRQNKIAEAAAWTKTQARKSGYPTLYGMSSNVEAFAEFFTFLALDDQGSSYIKPEVVSWFYNSVFSSHPHGKSCPPKAM